MVGSLGQRLVALVVCAFAQEALASPGSVRTQDGVSFAVPANMLPEAPAAGIEASYSDGGATPLQLTVVRKAASRRSLPMPSDQALRALSAGYLEGVRSRGSSNELFDWVPAVFYPRLGAYRVGYKVRAPSPVRQLLQEPDSSAAWLATARAGVDGRELRCVLSSLLDGSDAADSGWLVERASAAAQRCHWPVARVQQYIAQMQESFAARVLTTTGIAFVTRHAYIQVALTAPLSRAADVAAAERQLLDTAQVPSDIRLEPSLWNDVEALSPVVVGRLAGALFGPVLIVLLAGGALGWVLAKLGVRSPWTVPVICTGLLLLATLGALRTPVFSLFTVIQLLSYLAAVVFMRRPLTRWLGRFA
jgi:hypothetical protein